MPGTLVSSEVFHCTCRKQVSGGNPVQPMSVKPNREGLLLFEPSNQTGGRPHIFWSPGKEHGHMSSQTAETLPASDNKFFVMRALLRGVIRPVQRPPIYACTIPTREPSNSILKLYSPLGTAFLLLAVAPVNLAWYARPEECNGPIISKHQRCLVSDSWKIMEKDSGWLHAAFYFSTLCVLFLKTKSDSLLFMCTTDWIHCKWLCCRKLYFAWHKALALTQKVSVDKKILHLKLTFKHKPIVLEGCQFFF